MGGDWWKGNCKRSQTQRPGDVKRKVLLTHRVSYIVSPISFFNVSLFFFIDEGIAYVCLSPVPTTTNVYYLIFYKATGFDL